MIWEKLLGLSLALSWIPIIIFTSLFLYNTILGLTQIIRSLSAKTRMAAFQKLLWTQFLFACYHLTFSSSFSTWLGLKLKTLGRVIDVSALAVTTQDISNKYLSQPNNFGGIETVCKEGVMSFLVNSRTSLTLCSLIGAASYFGNMRTISYFAHRYKKLRPDAQKFLSMVLDVILHIEFFTGTYLWFKYCFVHIFADHGAVMKSQEAWNLGISHTLAFSVGVFICKDFILRTEKKGKAQEGKLVRYYSLCAISLLALSVVWQTIANLYDLPPPDEVYVACVVSIALFGMLPSRVLLGYVIPPIATFILSTAATEFVDFQIWGSLGNAICTLGGI